MHQKNQFENSPTESLHAVNKKCKNYFKVNWEQRKEEPFAYLVHPITTLYKMLADFVKIDNSPFTCVYLACLLAFQEVMIVYVTLEGARCEF